VLLKKFLEKQGLKKPYIIAQPMPMDKNIVQRVKTTIPNKIIFLDMAADQQSRCVKTAGWYMRNDDRGSSPDDTRI